MVKFTRRLAIKIRTDTEDKYVPKGVEKDKWYTVIGYNSRDYEKIIENKTKQDTLINFLVVGNNGTLVQVTSKNCVVTLDKSDVHQR